MTKQKKPLKWATQWKVVSTVPMVKDVERLLSRGFRVDGIEVELEEIY